jgi:hypothetical protein
MIQNSKLLFFISLLLFISATAQKSKAVIPSTFPDWRKDTFDYAKQIVPSKIKNDNTGELIPVTLKKAYITKADNDPVVLAICTVERDDKETSSLTYFFISPETNQMVSKFKSVLTVKGCDLTIPAFVIKDINGDKKDDFIFLELYNDKCKGDYWIGSNFHQIKPATTKNELDYYLKLRNDMRINRKVTTAETGQLQKKLEEVVAELFNH